MKNKQNKNNVQDSIKLNLKDIFDSNRLRFLNNKEVEYKYMGLTLNTLFKLVRSDSMYTSETMIDKDLAVIKNERLNLFGLKFEFDFKEERFNLISEYHSPKEILNLIEQFWIEFHSVN
jgi:hypothetical protein